MAQYDYYWQCDSTMPGHRKVLVLAKLLRVKWQYALGVVAALFCNVRRHAPSGLLVDVPDSVIAHWTGLKESEVPLLIEAGWVDADRKVHDWYERYGATEIKRQLNAERQRRHRVTRNAEVTPVTRDKRVTSQADVTETSVTARYQEAEAEAEAEYRSPNGELTGLAAGLLSWWNGFCNRTPGLVTAKSLDGDEGRRRKRARKLAGQILAATSALEVELSKPFYRGANDRQWQAGIDYLLQPGRLRELVEKAEASPALKVGPEQRRMSDRDRFLADERAKAEALEAQFLAEKTGGSAA